MLNLGALFFWSCLYLASTVPCPSDKLWYSSKHLLDAASSYSISIRVEEETLHIVLEILSTGWMGFGLAEQSTGTMLGSDIVTVYVSGGSVYIQDRHTMWYPSNWPTPPAGVFPEEDAHNDWVVNAGFEIDGKTAVHLSRALATDDPQDRDIRMGPQRIIWAYGPTDKVEYHGIRRGVGAIIFIPDDGTGDERTEITMAFPQYDGMASIRIQYAIPQVRTAYGCQAFRLPSERQRHIVAIRPVVDKVSAVVMGVVYICGESAYWKSLQNGQACLGNRPMSSWDNDCQGILFTWARGGEDLILPTGVGFRLGPDDDGTKFVVLEIHYDNPSLISGQVDESGVDFFWSYRAKMQPAGVLMLGDGTLKFPALPPKQQSVERMSTCPAQCTQLLGRPMHVFGSLFHMRSTGHKVYTTHYTPRNLDPTKPRGLDNFVGVTNRADFWRMGVRPFTPRSYMIYPGDRFHTHCIYNTTLKTTAVAFGSSSADEICAHYIFYYPAQFRGNRPFTFCGWSPGDETVCANNLPDEDAIIEDSSLQTPDPQDLSADPNNFGASTMSATNATPEPVCEPGELRDVLIVSSIPSAASNLSPNHLPFLSLLLLVVCWQVQ